MHQTTTLPVPLVGDGLPVRCADGIEHPYMSLDAGASTGALPGVADRVAGFLPTYSSVHRGAGFKSRVSTDAYEQARHAALDFAQRPRDDIAIFCRNTTDAINHLAYRLRLESDDVVLTTVVEHHANLLPWSRVSRLRFVECGTDGTFSAQDVTRALDERPWPRLLAVTGASNVTGWLPPIETIVDAAHERGVPVVLDAAQLAPHRPLLGNGDFVAWSGHKMYAPFGAGVLIGPRTAFETGDPFLHGGGAVELVDLDEVVWAAPPERDEAGSPNVIGAVAMHAAINEIERIGWDPIVKHERRLAAALRSGLASIPGVHLLGPSLDTETLAVASFSVEGQHHALVAARMSHEYGIGIRHGCFCAHPYLMRLLNLSQEARSRFRERVRAGDRSEVPGAVRASAGIFTALDDIQRFLAAVTEIASGSPPPVAYSYDPSTGDYSPHGAAPVGNSRACNA